MPWSNAGNDPHWRTGLDDGLLKVVDLAILGVLALVPLLMGGFHPIGRLVYVSLVAAGASAWCLRQTLSGRGTWRFSGIEALLACGAALLVLQLVALPPALARWLAPLSGELLPLWTQHGSESPVLGVWSCVSLMPQGTRDSLVIYLAHVLLFLLVVQRIDSAGDVERLLQLVAATIVAMAALGLAQFLLSNGKFLWVYEHPYRTTDGVVKGPFANENHFSHLLALGVGPLLWLLRKRAGRRPGRGYHAEDSRRREARKPRSMWTSKWQGRPNALGFEIPDGRRLWSLVGLGTVALAGLLTFSRGGVIIVFLASLAAVVSLLYVRALRRNSLFGLGFAAMVVVAALCVFGLRPLTQQLETLGTGSLDQLDTAAARRKLWAADLEAFSHAPILGTGAGTHAAVYPAFFPHYAEVEFTQAESGYIQVLLETGLAGAAIVLALVGAAFWWTVKTLRHAPQARLRTCAAAILPALIVSAVHTIWDFVWFFPGCLAATIILAGCGCRLYQFAFQSRAAKNASPPAAESPCAPPSAGVAWTAATLVVVGIGAMMIGQRIGPARASVHWEGFLRLQRTELKARADATASALLAPLSQTLQHDPAHARAHLRMAALCVRQFEEAQAESENPMPLSQIRDAARASKFASRAEQDKWLARVIGDNRRWLDAARAHARAAQTLCPLQGQGYVLLAELSFLDGPDAVNPRALLQQALLVRPHDAHVLYAAGREAALSGRTETALEFWKRAFDHDPKYRAEIIATVAPRVSAQEMLAHFEPDLQQTRELYRFYRDTQADEPARVVARRLVALVEQDAAQAETRNRATRAWHEAHRLYAFLGENEKSLHCIRQAARLSPHDFALRKAMAAQLLTCGQHEEALAELRWCRRRKPHDDAIDSLWKKTQRAIVESGPYEASRRREAEPPH